MIRREFLQFLLGAPGLLVPNIAKKKNPPHLYETRSGLYPDIVHVEKGTVRERIQTAIDALGGINRFIKPGDKVVLKPNAAFAQLPEMGGNTTPEVVKSIIQICKKAQPGSISVVEHCLSLKGRFGTKNDVSGISQAAEEEGIRVFDAGQNPSNYKKVKLSAPQAEYHGINKQFLDADVVINIPRAKMHPFAGYTLCVKNLMGTMQKPRIFHTYQKNWIAMHWRGLQQKLGLKVVQHPHNLLPANLVAFAKFMQNHITLNIVDMTHLVRDWDATKPGKLEKKNTIIAGINLVTTDAYCVKMFGEEPLYTKKLGSIANYVAMMHQAGVGNANLDKSLIKRIVL